MSKMDSIYIQGLLCVGIGRLFALEPATHPIISIIWYTTGSFLMIRSVFVVD